MSGQSANVNVSFTSSGAGAVVGDAAMVQGAISSITGKTVGVDYVSHGASGAVGEARAFDQAMKAGRASAADLGRETQRAARSTAEMGREARTARGHMQGLHGDVRALAAGAAAAGSRMGITSGAREAHRELSGANRAMGELENTAGKASVAVRQIHSGGGVGGGGAIKDAVLDMQKLSDGTWGVAEGMKAIGSAQKSGGGGAKQFDPSSGTYSYPYGAPADRSGRTQDAAGGKSSPAAARMAEIRRAAAGIDEAGESTEKAGKSAGRATDLVGGLGKAFGMAQNAGWQMAMVGGMMAGVTGEAASLSKATAGLGMNFAGMNSMLDRTMQTTARGQGLNLGAMDSGLRQSARTMTSELAPAIKSTVGAVGAMETAKMGAWGALGGDISQFANTVKGNAGPIQSIMKSLGSTVLGLGSDVVSGVAQAAPAFAALAQTVAGNGPDITAGAKSLTDLSLGVADMAVKGLAGFGQVDTAVKGALQGPGGQTGAERDFGIPAGGGVLGVMRAKGRSTSPITPGGFDPSKPFSGTLPDGTAGGGEPAAGSPAKTDLAPPRMFSDMAKAGGGSLPMTAARQPSKDADWSKGMTGAQAYEHQRAAAGLGPEGAPAYSGTGPPPAHFGSGVRPMPVGAASGLGMSGGTALPALMSSMSSAVGGGGAELGQAATQHIQKAVHQAAPAAQAGGSAMGAAMGGGMAQGYTSTQAVTDTLIIKHSKHIVDIASAALGVRSPSTKFDYLGRMSQAGFGQGWEREAGSTFGSMRGVLSAQQDMAAKYAPGYDGSQGATVTVSRPQQANQYSSPLANANIDAHNARAAALATGRENLQRQAIGGMTHDERRDQLLQARAGRHEKALANLGVAGHSDPSRNANPFAGDQHPSLWNTITKEGPLGDLKAQFSKHGESMTQGVGVGIVKGAPAAQNHMSQFSRGMQNQHKKDHGISSPSTVFAADGMDMAAGVGVGFAAGAGSAASVMSAAGLAMSMALKGPMDDYGLQVGYTFAQAMADGSSREIKTANFSALGMPSNLNPTAMSNLAGTGLLRAGSGAKTWKTSSGGVGTVTLPAPAPPPISVTLQPFDVHIGDQVVTVAGQVVTAAFDQFTSTYNTL